MGVIRSDTWYFYIYIYIWIRTSGSHYSLNGMVAYYWNVNPEFRAQYQPPLTHMHHYCPDTSQIYQIWSPQLQRAGCGAGSVPLHSAVVRPIIPIYKALSYEYRPLA